MENGSHLTLALLANKAPELVEIGIATDAIFAVIIMVVLVNKNLPYIPLIRCKTTYEFEGGNAMYEQWIIALLIAPLAISLASFACGVTKSTDNLYRTSCYRFDFDVGIHLTNY